MIDRTQLRKYHDGDLPLHILEQDYVQALFLQELYRETDSLVFKGGTFLKHAHGLDRYSEDLDFTTFTETTVTGALSNATAGLDRYGLPADFDHIETTPTTFHARLRYTGPLYDGTSRSRGSIDLEVSTRDDIFRDPEWIRLFFPYPETRAVTARCLCLEEAFAEKLRALATRSRGRDLYDIWFLLQQNVTVDPTLFAQKMGVLDEPPEVSISISEGEWNRDLDVLLSHPPDYNAVLDHVVPTLRDEGLNVSMETG